MALHSGLSLASRTHYSLLLLVHFKISLHHVFLFLPLLLVPSIFPSNNTLCFPLPLINCSKYFNFFYLTVNNYLGFSCIISKKHDATLLLTNMAQLLSYDVHECCGLLRDSPHGRTFANTVEQ